MDIWFIAALVAMVFGGLSNFYFKIAAKKGYDSEVFTIYNGVISLAYAGIVLAIFPEPLFGYGLAGVAVFMFGCVAACIAVLKVYALRHIDATLYFPLFKLVSPTLVIFAGIILFSETFSGSEWAGLIIGLFVPLLLISKVESARQSNLAMGLFLVLVTGVFSAMVATANKWGVEVDMPIFIVLLYTVSGIFVGSALIFLIKNRSKNVINRFIQGSSKSMVIDSVIRSVLISTSVWIGFYAYEMGGSLAIVQTIHSMYILIPVVLAILVYKEHWNTQKVLAILLAVASLAFLG